MRPKTLNCGINIKLDEITTIKINPGPGTYEKVDTLTKDGKVFVAKYRYYGAT
jgi:hypothetical protein